jgi:hypothetical protein
MNYIDEKSYEALEDRSKILTFNNQVEAMTYNKLIREALENGKKKADQIIVDSINVEEEFARSREIVRMMYTIMKGWLDMHIGNNIVVGFSIFIVSIFIFLFFGTPGIILTALSMQIYMNWLAYALDIVNTHGSVNVWTWWWYLFSLAIYNGLHFMPLLYMFVYSIKYADTTVWWFPIASYCARESLTLYNNRTWYTSWRFAFLNALNQFITRRYIFVNIAHCMLIANIATNVSFNAYIMWYQADIMGNISYQITRNVFLKYTHYLSYSTRIVVMAVIAYTWNYYYPSLKEFSLERTMALSKRNIFSRHVLYKIVYAMFNYGNVVFLLFGAFTSFVTCIVPALHQNYEMGIVDLVFYLIEPFYATELFVPLALDTKYGMN